LQESKKKEAAKRKRERESAKKAKKSTKATPKGKVSELVMHLQDAHFLSPQWIMLFECMFPEGSRRGTNRVILRIQHFFFGWLK